MRKDSYSSLGYNYTIMKIREKNLNTDSYSSDFSNFTPCISSIIFEGRWNNVSNIKESLL